MGRIFRAGALTATVALASVSAMAQNVTVYLFDRLEQPAYARAWAAMLKGQPALPFWLASKAGGTPQQPGQQAVIEGHDVELYFACQPHDCSDNRFVAMFLDRGKQAKGVLVVAGKPPRFFGRPDPAEAAALLRATR